MGNCKDCVWGGCRKQGLDQPGCWKFANPYEEPNKPKGKK